MQLGQQLIPIFFLYTTLSAIPVDANVLIDPTRPTKIEKTTSTDFTSIASRGWKLESILVASDRRVAVINGKLVSEGELVEGARIIKIHKLEVLIQTQGGRMTLQLLPDIVTKQP